MAAGTTPPRADPPPLPEDRQRQYPCSSCGAALEFAPGTASMVCRYCGSQTTITAGASAKHDFAGYTKTPHPAPSELPPHTLTCGGCGATRTTTALSSRCPSCNGALVVSDDLDGRLKTPDGVVPFVVAREQATASFRDWARSRWFAPNALKKVVRTDSMTGGYLPYWGFDDRTVTDYTGERGEHYWDTETYTVTENGQTETRTRQVQRTRWYPASGRVSRDFVDVLVPSADFPDQHTLAKLGPWSAEDAVGYAPGFLAGFDTPRYADTAENAFTAARDEMAERIREDCRDDIGGDEQRVGSMHTTDGDVLFRLLLMPLWLATYVFAGRTYHVFVNANTGKVMGERPFSVVKILLLVAVLLAAVGVAVALVQRSGT